MPIDTAVTDYISLEFPITDDKAVATNFFAFNGAANSVTDFYYAKYRKIGNFGWINQKLAV